MPFDYKEHTGETWLTAYGKTLEEAFSEGAKAMFNVMVPIGQIEPRRPSTISCRAEARDLLFFEWLNALVVIKDSQGLIFSRFELHKVQRERGQFELQAVAWGEALDPSKHESLVDVKAATYSELSCVQTEDGWRVECVLDI